MESLGIRNKAYTTSYNDKNSSYFNEKDILDQGRGVYASDLLPEIDVSTQV